MFYTIHCSNGLNIFSFYAKKITKNQVISHTTVNRDNIFLLKLYFYFQKFNFIKKEKKKIKS